MIQTYNQVKACSRARATTASVVVQADDVRSGARGRGIDALAPRRKASDTFLPRTEVDYSEDNTVAEVDDPDRGRRHRPGVEGRAERGPR